MPVVAVGATQVEYDRRGAGRPLLLIHSLLTELTVFDRVVPLLGGHQVTRINLPGFGASAPLELKTLAEHADHVACVMDVLDMPRDTAVFGNGFGAFVALALAIGHGERFGKLIVADALAAFPEPARVPFAMMAERVSSGGMSAVLDVAIGRMFPPAFAQAHPELILDRRSRLGAVDAQCFARACLALAGMDLTASVGKIANPTLVLCGALDQTTPPALARELAQKIPGARYEEIPDSGHCPMLEQPDALAASVKRFLG
jgi:3-oxoadipate enol-lactonase